MAWLEVNVNLDRVAVALEKIAALLEAMQVIEEIPAQGEAKLHSIAGVRSKAAQQGQEWRAYGPVVRKGYGDE